MPTNRDPSSAAEPVLPGVTSQHLVAVMGALCVIVILGGSWSLYSYDQSLPPPGRLPMGVRANPITRLSYKDSYFSGLVDQDIKNYKLEGFTLKDLRAGNPKFAEFSGDQTLKANASLETDHLTLKLTTKKVPVGEEGNQIRLVHLLLSITNKTDKHLAYRVDTKVVGACGKKGVLPHNAIVLKPQQAIVRTECMPRKRAQLHIKRVEVMELSPLGYHYVSRLDPQPLKYDPRTSEGHVRMPEFKQCKIPLPWRAIGPALERGEVQWYDVVDFYSRHNCDEYSFHTGYQWRAKGPAELPSKPKR